MTEEIKADKYVVLGGSGGGPVALHMALKFPERVKALLLVCAITGEYKHEWYDQIMNDSLKSVTIGASVGRMGASAFKSNPKSQVNEGLKVSGKYDAKTR